MERIKAYILYTTDEKILKTMDEGKLIDMDIINEYNNIHNSTQINQTNDERQDISVEIGQHYLNYRVSAVIRNRDKILVHHSAKIDHCTLIGGRIQEGEDSIEALKREVKEEIGFDTQYVCPIAIVENFYDAKDRYYHEILFVHELKFIDKSVYNLESYEPAEIEKKDVLKFKWIRLSDDNEYKFVPKMLKKLLTEGGGKFQHIINRD